MSLRFLRKTLVFSVTAMLCYGLFVSCENPFTSGLGAKVDIEPPTIKVTSPVSGEFLRDVVTFSGEVTAYRELHSVHVRILNPDTKDTTKKPLLDWTNIEQAPNSYSWIKDYTLTGGDKEKTWSLVLDTRDLFVRGGVPGIKLDDGFMRIQFGVYDKNPSNGNQNLFKETVELVYIVKNNPSEVQLAIPRQESLDDKLNSSDPDENPEKIVTGTEIRGEITDKRGLRPGYPMIKIWPYGSEEPAGDDNEWGWVSLFLNGVDNVEDFTYVDRNKIRVVNSQPFVFKLSKFFRPPTDPSNPASLRKTEASYYKNGGVFVPFETGLYKFRIITSDTYFNSIAGETDFMKPREPFEGEENPIIGYVPSKEGIGSQNTWDSGTAYTIQVVSAGERPIVELNYDTLDPSPSEVKAKLAEVPNIYLSDDQASRYKIAQGKTGTNDFQLQILATHPEGITRATLQYEHAESGRGSLPWDDTFDSGYVTDGYFNAGYEARDGHTGWWKIGEESKGTYFRFSADGGLRNGGNPIFVTSTEPYTLTMRVYPSDEENYTDYVLYMYMDGKVPDVSISSVQGASEDPVDSGIPHSAGGIVNNANAYTVNGNIRVAVNPSDSMGILSVRWIVQEDEPDDSDTGTMLGLLKQYRDNPIAANYNLINGSFTNKRMSGIETNPGTTARFIFNTWKDSVPGSTVKNENDWHGEDLWLYVIAEDGMHNLGFVVQKLTVDDDGDKPILTTPDIISTDGTIKTQNDLYYIISNPSSGNEFFDNKLAGEGIAMTFDDDDGIKLADVIITLKNLNDNKTVTLEYPELRAFLGGSSATVNNRQWSGIWKQDLMAEALYGKGADGKNLYNKLPDGYYYLSIKITDNIDAKVEIIPNAIPGDKPVAVSAEKEFYFAVQVEDPVVDIIYPTANATLNKGNISLHGTVSSRVKIQKLEIVYDPNIITPNKNNKSPPQPITLYRNRTGTNETNYAYSNPVTTANLFNDTATAAGTYLYYWTVPNVNFDPFNPNGASADDNSPPSSTEREFTVTAYDGLNNAGDNVRTVNVDADPPEINLDLFNFGRVDWDNVNGKVPIEIKVFDPSGVKTTGTAVHLKWWVLRSDATTFDAFFAKKEAGTLVPADYTAAWNTASPTGANGAGGQFQTGSFSTKAGDELGGGRYLAVFDTRNFTNFTEANNFRYLIYAMAEDGVGNISDVELLTFTRARETDPKDPRYFKINNTTGDDPVMDDEEKTEDSLSPQRGKSVRNLGADSGLTIHGVVSDDDGFDSTKTANYVKIRFPSATWRNANPNPSATPTSITWDTAWLPVPAKLKDPANIYEIEFDYPVRDGYLGSEGYKFYQLQIGDEPAAGAVASGDTYGTPPGKNPERAQIGTLITSRTVYYPGAGTIENTTNYYSFLLKNYPPQVYFAHYDPDYLHHPDYNQGWNPENENDKDKIDEFFNTVWGPNGPSRPAFRELADYTVNGVNNTGLRNALKGGYILEGTGVRSASFLYNGTKTGDIKNPDTGVDYLTTRAGPEFAGRWYWEATALTDAVWNIWLAPFNTSSDGLHRIGIEAEDSAGNTTLVEWSFYRDRTGPGITFTTISPADPNKIVSGRSGDVTIRGGFNDSYSDIADTYEYRFDHQSTWTTGRLAIANETPNQGTKNGRTAQWVITIPKDDTNFKDGVKTLFIRVADMAGNWTETYNPTPPAPPVTIPPTPPTPPGSGVPFILDRNAPVTSDPDGMVVSGAGVTAKLADVERVFSAALARPATGTPPASPQVFILSGVVYDKYLSSLTVSSPTPIFGPGVAPSYTPLSSITLTGIDTWNKTGTYSGTPAGRLSIRRVNTTTTPPDIGVGPAQYTRIHNEIAESDYDPLNLYVWSLLVTQDDLYNILNPPPANPGDPIPPTVTNDNGETRRQLTITARDQAGLNSENKNWRFYLDSEPPTVEFLLSGSYINDLPLDGTASDSNNIKQIKYFISRSIDGTGSNASWRYYDNGWTLTALPTTPVNYSVKANWPVLYDSTADDDPKKTVLWALDNARLTKTRTDATAATQRYFPPANLPEGRYRVQLYVTDFSLSATGAGNPVEPDITFFIDKSEPQLSWVGDRKDYYRLADLSSADTFKVTVSDPNYVASLTGEVRPYGSSTPVTGSSVSFAPTFAPTLSGTFSAIISGLNTDGRYTLYLTVTDRAGRVASENNTVDFTLDRTPPKITVSPTSIKDGDPEIKTYVGRIPLRGSFFKATGKSPISRVAFALATTTDGTNFTPSPTVPAPGTANFENVLKTNGWYFENGRGPNTVTGGVPSNPDNNPVLLDGTKRLAEIFEGLANANMVIPNTRHLMTDIGAAAGTRRYLGNNEAVTGVMTFNGANILTTYGSGVVNKMVIHFLAIDEAGNPETITETYYIYPEGDRPITTILNPSATILDPSTGIVVEPLLNGRIRLGGTALDNVYVKNVWFRVFVSNTSARPAAGATPVTLSVPVWDDDWNEGTLRQGSTTPGVSGAGKAIVRTNKYDSPFTSNGGWYMANGGGRRNPSWWAYINVNDELSPPSGGTNRIYIEVLAEDSVQDDYGDTYVTTEEGMYSNRKFVEALVVSDAPKFGIDLVQLGKSAELPVPTVDGAGGWSSAENTYVRSRASYAIRVDHINALDSINWTDPNGTVINLLDTTSPGKDSVSYNYNTVTYTSDLSAMDTGTGTVTAIAAKAVRITTGVTGSAVAYWVIFDINSLRLESNAWATKADNYPVTLMAKDTSKSTALSSQIITNIPIDNLKPKGYYTHTTNVVGSAPSFGGAAGDDPEGAIGGLSKVVLWFSRNGVSIPWQELNANGSEITPARAFQSGGTKPDGVTFSVDMPNIPAEDATLDNYSCIIIDRHDPMGTLSRYGHKHRIGFSPGSDLGTNWYVILDSTLMTSGRTTAHYLVYDKAGNASYYSQPLMILNNIPRITRITLGTDIRGDLGLQTAVGSGSGNLSISNAGASALQAIRNRFTGADKDTETILLDSVAGLEGDALDTAVGIRTLTVNTTTPNNYNVVYDERFNVRNNLLAIGVEIGENMRAKSRHYSVEYVTGAVSRTGANFYNSIEAGKVYMIDNVGTDFPWALFGAVGDAADYKRGFAFLATESGTNVTGLDATSTYGGAAVWELTTATGNRAVGPVEYRSDTSTTGMAGKTAEFVYRSGAFTDTPIPDYTLTTANTNSDGRPMPFLQSGSTPWANHSLFIVRVFDAQVTGGGINPSPGLDDRLFGDFALLSIQVNNNDETKPFAQLYDPNPKAEEEADLSDALDPQYMGDNRIRGGLWAKTENQAIVKSGHLEPRTTTSLTGVEMGGAANTTQASVYRPMVTGTAYFSVDTVSGEVILRGYVEDDQRIGKVDLQFGIGANTDATTANTITILEYNTGTTVGPLLKAAINTNTQKTVAGDRVSFTETINLDRHRVEWAYLWDSQVLPAGTIVGDVNVTVKAYSYHTTPASMRPSDTRTRDAANNTTFDYYNPDFPTYSASATNVRRYNRIPMNLRPYITGIIRNKATYSYQDERSMQGRYMLARGEEFVVAGFNLGGANTPTLTLPSAATAVTAAPNGSANGVLTTPAGQTAFALPNTNPYNYRVFSVPAAATTGTGIVSYTVGTSAAVNARAIPNRTPAVNRAIQPWNTERSPGIEGSDLWDDFTAVHIWQSNDTGNATGNTANNGYFRSSSTGTTANSWPILNPAMSIVPTTGVLHASQNENGPGGNEGSVRVSTNNATTLTSIIQFIDPIICSDVYYSPGTDNLSAGRWAVTSVIGQAGNSTGWGNLGGVWLQGPGGTNVALANLFIRDSVETGYGGYYGESTWYNAGNTNANRITDQFLNPHIITSYNTAGTTEYIHVSYYDRKDGSIKYRFNQRGSAGTVNANTAQRAWTNLDGGFDAEDQSAIAAGGTPFATAVAEYYRIVNYTSRPAAGSRINAGEHNAIAVTSAGYPVVAYYDATSQKLKLAVSGAVNPVHARNWVTVDVLPDGNPYKLGTGQYVSIAIDNGRAGPTGSDVLQNRIHIAAMNTNGNLVYIRGLIRTPTVGAATAYSATPNAAGTFTADLVQIVDNVGTVGRWCKISLDQYGRPWIAYQDDGKIGSTQGAKIAYRGTFTKELKDIYGTSISGWETMHIPMQEFRVENPIISGRENGRLGLECFPTRNTAAGTGNTQFWDAAVSYYSTYPQNRYRIVYYVR